MSSGFPSPPALLALPTHIHVLRQHVLRLRSVLGKHVFFGNMLFLWNNGPVVTAAAATFTATTTQNNHNPQSPTQIHVYL